jgi:tetratricopeptide (TPR) repeat protein
MKELDQMPESVKKMKIVCLMRIGAAQQIGTKEHQAVLEEVSKWYGNDPAMNFTMVDAYFLRNDYVNARKMIDSVDQTLGGDPYMEVLRGNSYFIEKNYAKAVECGERAIKAEPMLAPSYDVVLESHLNQKNYGALLETLKVFSKTFKVEPDAIANNPAYAAFAASEEWKKYKAEKK